MTDRMPDEQLDREIRSFLAWRAEDITEAPSTSDVAMRISSRVGTRSFRPGPTPHVGRVALAGLLILSLLGALVAGAMLLRDNPPPLSRSYEAVFLRLEVAAGEPIVHVVGVSTDGTEREIAALVGAWHDYEIRTGRLTTGYLTPLGALSANKLLAIPSSSDGDAMMHWEIFDLLRPNLAPVAVPGIRQDIERLAVMPFFRPGMHVSAVWGPGDRLAIPWFNAIPDPIDVTMSTLDPHLSFVEGRTGAPTSSIRVPDGVRILPEWAADGSGVLVSESGFVRDGGLSATPVGVLRPDGAVAAGSFAGADSTCRTRFGFGDEITMTGEIVPAGTRDEEVIHGTGFACLAPDDSAIVRNFDIGSGQGPASAWDPKAELIIPGSGVRLAIDGSFVGWLEVYR